MATTPATEQPQTPPPPEPTPAPPTAKQPPPESTAATPPKKKRTRRESKPQTSEPPPSAHQTPPEPPPAPPRAPEPPKTPEPPPKPKAKPVEPPVEKSKPAKAPTPAPSREPDAIEEAPDLFAPASDSSDRVVWQFPEVPPSASKRRPLRNCVAVSSSGAIIAAVGAKVVSLEETDGKVKVNWSYSTGARIPGSPALGSDDSVHVHSADGLLHCLLADGEQAWAPSNVGKPLGWSSPVVDERKNTWLSGYSGGLMKLSADGSHINRRYFRSREKFDSTGVLFDGVFYVGCDDGFVYAIRLEDRKGHNLWDQRANRGLTDWFVNSSPAIAPGPTIVVGSRDDYVYGFGADGVVTWKVHVDGQMLASPVIDPKGRVLVTVSRTKRGEKGSGALIAISSNSHQIEWQYPTDAPCESTPVIGDDEVAYFGDNAGIIHAVDHEGNRVWTAKLGSPVRSAGSIVAPERVVFGLDNETLVALQCSSKGLAGGIWPKYMGTLEQSGSVSG
ncbi:MAG: PQQ-binding-like beta-propeller repeat protein [Pirellulales bacterium]|nr:PQQ-binding-like beta-propeller repeat protein [Pirellulales bacterium]